MSIDSYLDSSDAISTTTAGPDSDLTTTIVETLARLEGTSPLTLDVRLGDVIDPDALEELFEPGPDDVGYVVFPLGEYLVAVHSNDEVTFHRR